MKILLISNNVMSNMISDIVSGVVNTRKQGAMEPIIHIASRSEVLQNYELLNMIFQFLNNGRVGQKDLLCASLTCKDFLSPALDNLWRSISLRPIILLASSENPKAKTKRKVSKTNAGNALNNKKLERLKWYARRTRHLFIDASETVDHLPNSPNAHSVLQLPIFPALRRLILYGLEKISPAAVPQILVKAAISPALSTLQIGWINPSVEPDTASFLYDVASTSCYIKYLSLRGELREMLINVLPEFTHLTSLEIIASSLPANFLVMTSMISTLESLKWFMGFSPYTNHGHQYPSLLVTVLDQPKFLPASFLNLRVLELECLAHVVGMFIDASSMYDLQELTIEFSDSWSHRSMLRVDQCMQSIILSTFSDALEKLQITFSDENMIAVPWVMFTFFYSSKFPQIKYLETRVNTLERAAFFSLVEQNTTHWHHLQTLYLSVPTVDYPTSSWQTSARASENLLSLSDVWLFAVLCPNLESLSLCMIAELEQEDISQMKSLSKGPCTCHPLQHLLLGPFQGGWEWDMLDPSEATLENDVIVARYLDRIFPNLNKVSLEFGDDDEDFKLQTWWNDVGKSVLEFQDARKQYHVCKK